jgi:HK97 family phage portal protein
MGFLSSLVRDEVAGEVRDSVRPAHPRDPVLAAWFGGEDGSAVNPDSALRVTAVYACVSLIAETIAALPLHVYLNSTDGKGRVSSSKADDHPLYPLLHDMPTPGMTSFEWREMMVTGTALRGESYARIVESRSGRIQSLVPILKQHITPIKPRFGQAPSFRWTPDGVGPEQILLDDEVLRIPYKMLDGYRSLSPVEVHRRTIGNSLDAARYLQSFYRNSAQPKGALTTDKTLTPPAAKALRESWEQRHMGPENAGRLAIFDGGLKFEAIGMTMDDAQYIELQNFSVTDIARIYLVPPHKIGELSRSTNNNIEHQGIEWVVGCLVHWLERIEQRLNAYLLSSADRAKGYFIEFDVKGLLRGDATARGNFYKALFYVGAINPNEIRGSENLNPYEGGDRFFVQGATVPIDKIDEMIAQKRITQQKDPSSDQPQPE